MGFESFTVLAIMEARDKASEVFAKIDETLGKFSETAKEAASTAGASGEQIDAGLGKAAGGADELAAAQQRAAAAVRELAAAKADVAAAAAAAAGDDADAAAADRLAAAEQRVTLATGQEELAQKALGDTFLKTAGKAGVYADSQGKLRDAQGKYVAGATEADIATGASGVSLGKLGKVAGITALGLGVAGGLMVKAAGNFQDSTAHLQTDAGVTAANLGMVRAGILQVSTATGQSASSITNAMYHIASSGFTASNGLAILKTVAQGARVGGADLDTTSKALVGTLTAYYGTSLTAAQATKYSTSLMNQMIQAVGSGDMRMQDLASSLSTVSPVAAAAGLSFAQVGGAVATMTAQGMTARQATLDLANTIRNLKSPNNVASQEMRALGLNANTVSQNLGKKGLAGTLTELRNAVLSNTSGGSVMLGYLKEMSPAAQGLANQIMAGSISTKELRTAVYGLNPQQAKLISLFDTAATSATGLKQTYTGAMAKMLGGSTGLNTALMLTGKHMSDLTKNTAAIAAKAKDASGNVDNWAVIQGTFNFKVSQAKTALENTGIAIGSALLPAASTLFSLLGKILIPLAEWTSRHKTLTAVLFIAVTALSATVAVLILAGKAFKAVKGAIGEVQSAYKGVVAVLQKLGILSKQTAGTQEAASGEAAAAAETDATETAAANETAAAESSGSWIAAAARQVASAAVWVAQGIGKVAVMVAANVAGAATTAAAWVIANAVMLLGIGLLIAAVVAAVVLIVKNWGKISAAAKVVFHDVLSVVDSVIGWVKSHWPLLLAILTGPIGLAVLMIKDHFQQVKDGALDVVHFIESSFKALLNLDSTLKAAGVKLVMGLVHGIESVAMAPVHAVEGIVSSVRNLLPFSPAKKGPLSGGGSPDIAGAKFATMFAGGIAGASGAAASAARLLAAGVSRQLTGGTLGPGAAAGIGSSLALSAIGPAGAGAGTVEIHVHAEGAHLMTDADMGAFVNKLGPVLNRALAQAGRKINIRG